MVKKEIIVQRSFSNVEYDQTWMLHIFTLHIFKFVASVSFSKIFQVNYFNDRNNVITSHKSNFVMSR